MVGFIGQIRRCLCQREGHVEMRLREAGRVGRPWLTVNGDKNPW